MTKPIHQELIDGKWYAMNPQRFYGLLRHCFGPIWSGYERKKMRKAIEKGFEYDFVLYGKRYRAVSKDANDA